MHRRTFLTSVTAVSSALAGCAALDSLTGGGSMGNTRPPTARLTMESMNDTELLSKGLYGKGIEAGPKAKRFSRILDGGASFEETQPLFPENRHLFYDGAVYQLSYEVTKRTPATLFSVRVDVVTEPASEAETIRFAELPAVDRETFKENDLANGETIGVGTRLLYTDTERKRSVLVPESDYTNIVWKNGSRAKWVVDNAIDKTVKTYRYSAKQIGTAKEYGRRLRERFAFELSTHSDAERDIIETAITKDQFLLTNGDPSSALVTLIDQFRNQKQVHRLNENGDGDLNGAYLVRYEGTIYWTRVRITTEAFPTDTST